MVIYGQGSSITSGQIIAAVNNFTDPRLPGVIGACLVVGSVVTIPAPTITTFQTEIEFVNALPAGVTLVPPTDPLYSEAQVAFGAYFIQQ